MRSPVGKNTTDLWRTPHRTDAETARVHLGRRARPVRSGVSRSARHERPPPSPLRASARQRRLSGRRRRGPPPGRGRGVGARQPALVGRRRAGLPGRARHGPRATPTSSGAPRGCARPTRTCSATSPAGGCWRSAAARRPARAGCGSAGADVVALDLSGRDAGPRRGAEPVHRASPSRCCRPTPARCPSPTPASTSPARRSAGCRSSPTSRAALRRGARGCCGPGGRFVASGQPPDALAVPRLPRPRRTCGSSPPTSTGRPTSRPTTTGGPSTSSTTAPSATGCARSSAPAWCSRTWSSRSGRRAAPRTGASGPPNAAPSSPAR